jgi:signal transduction histidine kinase
MKQSSIELPKLYVTALRRHLNGRGPADGLCLGALKLGRRALAMGMETLGLTRIHERALASMERTDGGKEQVTRAASFLSVALKPILESHQSSQQHNLEAQLSCLNDTLAVRTRELAVTNGQLKLCYAHHKCVEAVLKSEGFHQGTLLKEAMKLQRGLRRVTHKVLASQEMERLRISLELQDNVVQSLLGIAMKLVSVENAAGKSSKMLESRIAKSQRLVDKTTRSVRQIARKICRNA